MTMKQRRSCRRILLLSLSIPLFTLFYLFVRRGTFPFGEESLLHTDSYHQYTPSFSEFQCKLQHGGSLLCSWGVGLGVSFTAVYAYYLASPLNWFVVLFPKRYMIEFVTLLVVVKTALSSISMTYYLLRYNSRDGLFVPIFGVLYAFSAYMTTYSWDVMWLDYIVLFPLILLGTEGMVRGESPIKYILCFGLSILSNCYISIMICLFLVFYAVFQAITAELDLAETGKTALRFAVASLIAAGLAVVMLLLEIFALRLTVSNEMNFPKTFGSYSSVVDMMTRQLPSVECKIGLGHWPNIYCGVFTLQLLLLYFLGREVSIKQRVDYAPFLLFSFTSFSVNVLNYTQYGLRYPSSLPARQSFILCSLMLYLSFQTLERFPRFSPHEVSLSSAAVILFILFAEKLVTEEHFHFQVFYLAFLLVALYRLIFRSYATGQFAGELYFCMLLILVTLESALDLTYMSMSTTSHTEYTANSTDIRLLKKPVPETPFVRFKRYERESKDGGAFLNFHSVSLFSSTVDKSLTDFLRSVGCETSVNTYSITGPTSLVGTLLDVGCGFASDERYDENQEETGHSGSTVLIKNPNTLPLGFVAEHDFTDSWSHTFENPTDVQSDLYNLLNTPPVLIAHDTKPNGGQEDVTVEQDGLCFALATNTKTNKIKFSSDDKDRTFDDLKRRYLMELGYRKAGEILNFSEISDNKPEPSVVVYRFDFGTLKGLQQAMLKHRIQMDSYTGNTINAEVETEDSSLLFTNIPYGKDWTVYVDKKSVKTERAMGAFLAFRVPSGQCRIHFRCFPEGLKLGTFMSFLSLLTLAFFRRFKKNYEQRLRRRVTKRYEVLYQEIQETSLRVRAENLAAQQTDAEQAIKPIIEPEELSTAVSPEAMAEGGTQLVNFDEP